MDADWRVNVYRSAAEDRRVVYQDANMEFADVLGEICDENAITEREVMKTLGSAYGDVILGAAHSNNILRVFKKVGIKNPDQWSDRVLGLLEEKLGLQIWDQTDALLDRYEPRSR